MYHEQIAKVTADHLRSHIGAYLDEVNGYFNDEVTLTVPKSIEVASVVGGLFTQYDSILPQYGIDMLGKIIGPDIENLITWQYVGQINGLVHGGSDAAVIKNISRHAAAVELFIRRHEFMHEHTNDQFTILSMIFQTVTFSGAEDLGEVEGRELWLAGFSIDLAWAVSEDGSYQHG